MKSGSAILFEEVQSRTSRQTISFFRVLLIITSVALILNLVVQKGIATSFTHFLIVLLVILLLLSFILPFRLTTQIRSDGIYVRFPPFQPGFAKFYWNDISEVYIRSYDALAEYYGWGLKISANGTGYIVAGNVGIQIILKTGNKVLVTTQKPGEVNEILKRVEKL